jgi:4-amino-4-deoxy-L-arabinose transferase-like glycosyltransferase
VIISRFLVVAALASALLFPNLNRGGLSGYDDALYAHEGREMLETGDWWTVHFNGAPNFEYPPVFLWLEAASIKAFGVNDYAAKLPSALAGLGTILILYFLVLELTRDDEWLATLAMFVLTSTQLFMKYATHAMTDVPFTFFVTLALYLYVKGLRQRWYFALAGIAVAAAILTRSVIGVFPLGVMAAHLLFTKRYRLMLSLQFVAMWVIALGLPLVWFGFPPRPEHMAFVAGKLAGGSNWLEYGWTMLRFYWPWLPLLLVGVVVEVRARKLLPLIWCVCLVVPLSVATTKYARYLIPAFPAMAIITATGVDRLLHVVRRAAAFWTGCAVLSLVAAFTVVFPAKERGVDMRTLAPVAMRNTQPSDRILLYTMGEPGYDTQNQLLWYSGRYTRLITDIGALAQERNATVIIDKTSLQRLESALPAARVRLLAESEKFVCLRIG